mmetsp:Transcript_2246/g.8621  ORF Transcript_2246/g.8621 Transcript_2246/m.8621 type:complete len:224 (-) Transcript_2246:671-1342(-)
MLGILSEFHPLPSASVKARTKKKSRTKSTARETERPKPTSLAKRQRASSSRRLRLPLVLLQKHIKRGFQGFNRVVFVREFVQTEQTDPKRKVARGFVDHKRHARRDLKPLGFEPGEHIGLVRVPHADAGGFETGGADGPQTFALHHRPALVPKRPRRVRGSAEPHLFRFQSCVPEQVQRVRGHGGVVRETSADVAVHHLEPLPHVDHHGRGRGVPCGVIAALA